MKLNIQLFASVSSSKYDGRYLKLTATETATSIENNTSTIHWKFESIGGSSSYYTIYEYGVFYNGIQLYDGNNGLKNKNYSNHTFPVTKGSVEGDITIEHNADGTAANVSFAMFGSVYKNKTNQYDLSLPLSTIPRSSQPRLSSSNVDMGTTITIYTDRVSTTFTHTIRFAFGNASGTIASNVGDSTSWTPSVDLANQIPSAANGYGEIYCDTYSNGTLIGTKAVGIVLNVPSNIVPSVSFTQVQEAGDVPSSWGVYVKTKSRIALAISGSGTYSSSITGYLISYYGGSINAASGTTSYLTQAETTTFTGQVTDTRGRSASIPTTINVVDYYNPTISTAQVQRCDENGNIDNNGEYMYISYGGSISSCNGNNTSEYKVGYRVHNVGDYQYIPLATNTTSYSASGMLYTDGIYAANRGSGTKVQFSSSNTFDIQFYVGDYFTNYTNLQLLDTGFDLMNFNPSGKSMAIGKVSEASANEELFEVGIDTEIDGDLDVSGTITGAIDGSNVWSTFKTLSGNTRLNLQQILTPKANDGLAKYNRLGGIDFNDLVEYGSGLYSVVGTAHSPGGANNQWWQVIQIVMPDANYVQQYASQMFDGRNIWVRTGVNGSYGEWLLISNTYNNIAYFAGIWTDGSYVKRQVIEGTLDSNGSAWINFGKKIIKAEGFVLSNYGQWWPLGQYYWGEAGYSTALWLPGGTQLQITTAGYYTQNNQYFVIVEYVE